MADSEVFLEYGGRIVSKPKVEFESYQCFMYDCLFPVDVEGILCESCEEKSKEKVKQIHEDADKITKPKPFTICTQTGCKGERLPYHSLCEACLALSNLQVDIAKSQSRKNLPDETGNVVLGTYGDSPKLEAEWDPKNPPPGYARKGIVDEGIKADEGKARYDLIPEGPLNEVAQVLNYGCNKYSARNWEKGLLFGRCFAAMNRHMWAFWRGEDIDPESGLMHLAHVVCNAMFLMEYSLRGTGTDDRPKENYK